MLSSTFRSSVAVVFVLATAWTAAPVFAGSGGRLPDGFVLGRWVVEPYFEYSYEYEDNVFRVPDPEDLDGEGADNINTLTAGVEAKLPVRNSLLTLGFTGTLLTYDLHQFDRDTDLDGWVEFDFNFASFDTLSTSVELTDGFTDVGQADPGGELVFRGEPYRRARVDLEVQRSVPLRAGYYARLSYVDHNYERPTVSFFDYDGWDAGVEYRQPLASYKWLVGYVGVRRFDNYQGVTEEPTRKERSETFQLGLRGLAGKDQPFVIRLGWGRFEYELVDQAPFAGLTAFAQWRLAIGGRSTLAIAAVRRPLPSNYDTYYVNGQLEADFERDWGRYSSFGAKLRFDNNAYGSDSAIPGCAAGVTRHDKRYELEAWLDWRVTKYLGYEMSVARERRNSSCPGFAYDASNVSAGVRVGW